MTRSKSLLGMAAAMALSGSLWSPSNLGDILGSSSKGRRAKAPPLSKGSHKQNARKQRKARK